MGSVVRAGKYCGVWCSEREELWITGLQTVGVLQ